MCKKVIKCCDTCEFNFPNGKGRVCVGQASSLSGTDISVMKELFPDGCSKWKESGDT